MIRLLHIAFGDLFQQSDRPSLVFKRAGHPILHSVQRVHLEGVNGGGKYFLFLTWQSVAQL